MSDPRQSRRRQPSAGPARFRAAQAAVLAAFCAASDFPAVAGGMGPAPPLRIASFDLSAAPGVAAGRPAETPKPSWRTSFGSEIRNEERRTLTALDLDADVVLLQGLSSMREARRLFPAREWKLVVSRQLLTNDDPLASWSRDVVASVPATAVAVRYQKGLRVSGQDHLMDLASPEQSAGGAKVPPAGTAVRLNLEGRAVWLVSVALPADCATDVSRCPAHGVLTRWREARRSDGEPTIVGGRLSAPLPVTTGPTPPPPPMPNVAGAPQSLRSSAATTSPGRAAPAAPPLAAQACSDQSIVSDPGATSTSGSTIEWHAIAGCLASLELMR